MYFSGIRHRVVSVASKLAGPGNVGLKAGAAYASLGLHLASSGGTDEDRHMAPSKSSKLTDFDVRRNTIWCTLVFRMICWLLLHDFDAEDVQLPKSEVLGSCLTVYIQ